MMTLRPFTSGDAPTVLSWIGDEVTFWRWSADRYGHYPITPAELTAQYARSANFAYMAEVDGVPVGHFTLRWPGEGRESIRAGFILLDPARRGHGDGKAMLRLAFAEAKWRHSAGALTLGVFADNAPARHCYEAVGLAYTGEEHTYTIGGREWPCLEMRIDL